MKRLALVAFTILASLTGYHPVPSPAAPALGAPLSAMAESGDGAFARAYRSRTSDIQLTGSGTVVRVLPDDTRGSRHQRFIVRLDSGQSLLIAHNIDLAPRVPSLKKGDRVRFSGEYEWNKKGGTMHWTHHDPRGVHEAGWIEHNGQKYQ